MDQSMYDFKSSPRSSGSRSPIIMPRQDSSGTLKTTISLGKTPSIVHTGPFYLLKEQPVESELTGATNLMAYYNLEHAYNKFTGKKVKDALSSFLPSLPGAIDMPGEKDNSSLRLLIDKPPIGGKELLPLNSMLLSGFRLHPGSLPEDFKQTLSIYQGGVKKKKKKKDKHRTGDISGAEGSGTGSGAEASQDGYEKKHKKQKKSEEDKDKKKRKKEKKKKRQKHSPDHTGMGSGLMTPGTPKLS